MKTNSLSTEYGYQSPEFQTFISAQAQLISSIATNGHPDEQLAAVRLAVTQGCAEARQGHHNPAEYWVQDWTAASKES